MKPIEIRLVEIFLPWPDVTLKPNGSHRHWSVKAGAKKNARRFAKFMVMENHKPIAYTGELGAHFTIYPPDRRFRDMDNIKAMLKPYMDGVFDALGMDDRQIRRSVTEFDEPIKGGGIKVVLTELKHD